MDSKGSLKDKVGPKMKVSSTLASCLTHTGPTDNLTMKIIKQKGQYLKINTRSGIVELFMNNRFDSSISQNFAFLSK